MFRHPRIILEQFWVISKELEFAWKQIIICDLQRKKWNRLEIVISLIISSDI